jgi:hypothetical protein
MNPGKRIVLLPGAFYIECVHNFTAMYLTTRGFVYRVGYDIATFCAVRDVSRGARSRQADDHLDRWDARAE